MRSEKGHRSIKFPSRIEPKPCKSRCKWHLGSALERFWGALDAFRGVLGPFGASWGHLGASLKSSWDGFGAVLAAYGRFCEACFGASLGALRHDFRTKLQHLRYRFTVDCYCFFPVYLCYPNAWKGSLVLQIHRFEPSSDLDTKLFQDVILKPTCPDVASHNAPKSTLGGVSRPLGSSVVG